MTQQRPVIHANPTYVGVVITIIFALTVNAVYFAYQHGRLEQQVLDEVAVATRHEKAIEDLRAQQLRNMEILTQQGQMLNDIYSKKGKR